MHLWAETPEPMHLCTVYTPVLARRILWMDSTGIGLQVLQVIAT